MKAVRILALVLVVGIVVQMAPPASADGGPTTVYGYVYISDGTKANETDAPSGSVPVTVIIMDENGKLTGKRYTDTLNADSSGNLLYSITIQDGDWESGWRYSIEVDGSPWGDVKYKAEDRQNPGVFEWSFSAGGSLHDVRTLSAIPVNYKPVLALVFAILLAILGLLLVAVLTRQKVDVVIVGKSQTKDDRGRPAWKYACAYSNGEEMTELGEVVSLVKYEEGSVVRVSVGKIVRDHDNKYVWYAPKMLDMGRLPPGKLPAEPAKKRFVDNRWFLGGCVKSVEGQGLKSAVRRRKAVVYSALVLPFVLVELLMGAASLYVKWLEVPPWLGPGLMLNLFMLVLGLIIQSAYLGRSVGRMREEKLAQAAATHQAKARTAAPAVIPEAPKAGPAPPQRPPAAIMCPDCGQEILPDYKMCPFCGKSLEKTG